MTKILSEREGWVKRNREMKRHLESLRCRKCESLIGAGRDGERCSCMFEDVPPPSFWTVDDCARAWHAKRRTVLSWFTSGYVPGAALAGLSWVCPVGTAKPVVRGRGRPLGSKAKPKGRKKKGA